MALNETAAIALAHKILIGMAESGSLKTAGALIQSGSSEESNTRRGKLDAAYLSSLYRDLVNGLQE